MRYRKGQSLYFKLKGKKEEIMESYVVRLRRELHENPEVGYDLTKTLEILRRELDEIGVEYTEKYGKSSIVATVNPEKTGFTIGVRADIDALPIEEKADVPFRSKNKGRMHACGHDAHAAMAMNALREIYAMRDSINCRVKFIFQASEEASPSGAALMAADGVMDDIDCIIGQHVELTEPSGVIDVSTDDVTAISTAFDLKFYGKRDHALRQYNGVDAIMIAVNAYNAIEMMLSKNIDGREVMIFNVGKINGGEARNIVAAECTLECTLRTLSDEMAEIAVRRIKEISEATAAAWGGRFEFIEDSYHPKVVNNRIMAERVVAAARAVIGDENVTLTTKPDKEKNLGGEDFSCFSRLKPACMFHTGIRNEEKGCIYGGHTDRYKIDEDALEPASKVIVRFILDNMNGIEGI